MSRAMLRAFMGGGVAPPTYATWNPSDKGASVTLSNGNLTAVVTTTYSTSRATLGKLAGKWYWEITQSNYPGADMGVSTTSELNTYYLGQGATGWSITYGYINNNSTQGGGYTFTNSDVLGFALDMDAGTLKLYKNGTLMGTLATGLSGMYYPSIGSAGVACTYIANFGASAFAYSVPSSYNSGVYFVSTPFTYTIAANTSNVNLYTAAIAAGWDGWSALTCVINAGVTVTGTTYGIIATGLYPNGLTITNNGIVGGLSITGTITGTATVTNNNIIYGNKGYGGGGGWGDGGGIAATAGSPGGTALNTTANISVTNTGSLIGGGGGGGGGGGSMDSVPGPQTGGTGGNGAQYGVAATGGGGGWAGYDAGGNGGAVGVAGGSGAAGTATGGAGGGAAGYSAYGNSHITWLTTGTRTGPQAG